MKNKEKLLSICIPTYNGGSSYLDSVLKHTIILAEQYPGEIEVIVSDNSSTDSTSVIIESYLKHDCLRSYRNETNIGFKRNMLLLTDTYACGKYLWIIGDDDFIIPAAFSYLIEKLRNRLFEFISIGSNIIHLQDLDSTLKLTSSFSCAQGTYAYAIDRNCYEGNVLATFMGGAIFLRNKFRDFPKDFINNSFNEFRNVFPNGFILASVFYDSKCGCIPQTCIVSVSRDKSWSTTDIVYKIFSRYLPDLYSLIISKGYHKRDLRKTYSTLLYKETVISIIRKKKGETVNGLFPLFVKLLCSPSVLFRVIKSL